jgi:cyclic pyranopterin phosphate synthase
MNRLTHVDAQGRAKMVDVSEKTPTLRTARAEGVLRIKQAHREALSNLPKGDALTVAQIAGIQGGKRCSELIPLCHPVALTDLQVSVSLQEEGIRIEAQARTVAVTGVEMEAYTAVVVAGITLIDMLKGVDPDLELTGVRLLEKKGGKKDFKREG